MIAFLLAMFCGSTYTYMWNQSWDHTLFKVIGEKMSSNLENEITSENFRKAHQIGNTQTAKTSEVPMWS